MEVNGPKQRALLILLLLHANSVLSTDKIVDALWGEHWNGKEAGTLRVHVSNLRKALEPARANGEGGELVVTQPPGYLLRADADTVDANRFERLAAEGRRALGSNTEHAAQRLTEALDLWRGSPLEDVAYESFAQPHIQRLNELRLSTLEDLIEARLARNEDSELVGELESLVAQHPYRERMWGQLMLALYRSGRQTDALATHRRLSDILGRQGLAPGPGVNLLEDRILINDPTLLADSVRLGPHRHPPAERTRLVGRERELTELRSRFDTGRLLTLTGTGGVGKTRLAQRLAWSLIEEQAQVWWVELGGLTDAQRIPEQVAAAGGVSQGADVETVDLLVRLLWARDTVIVLDNCEHLVEGTARLVDRLLTEAPGLRFIVTSREPLQVGGEAVWRVPSLAVPDQATPEADLKSFPSVELFLERARAGGVEVDPYHLSSVATICRRLDGIPLALELAAARTTSLTPGEISERLADRFALLERGGRTALARHRTLEAAIDWSFRALDESERRLLSRLAVFVASFDREAAEQVCAFPPLGDTDVEVGLERLVEKSMIEYSTLGPDRRFRLTESIRAFTWDRLVDDPDEVLGRHRDWALGLAITGGKMILSDEGRWFPRLEAAHEDFRAAFNESLHRGETDLAVRLVGSINEYLLWRRTNEALKWLEIAIDVAEETPDSIRPSTRALGMLSFGPFLCFHNRLEEGRRRMAQAADIYTDLDHRAGLAWTRYQQSYFPSGVDPGESVGYAESAVDLARQISEPVLMAYTLARLAGTRLSQVRYMGKVSAGYMGKVSAGDLEAVTSICDEAASYCEPLPHAYASAMLEVARGTVLGLQGDPAGLDLVEHGVIERTRFAVGVPCAAEFVSASELAHHLGLEERASALLRGGLEAFKRIGLHYAARSALVGSAAVLYRTQPSVATKVLSAARPLQPSVLYGTGTFEDERQMLERVDWAPGNGGDPGGPTDSPQLGVREAIDLALDHIG